MSKQKVIVTGANGQVASELRMLSEAYSNLEFVFFSREALPVDDAVRVSAVFREIQPQYCINCAAYTAVDKAEIEKDMAFLINGEAPGLLALVCATHQTKFIHLSTDYVYNGVASAPYTEEQPVDPVNTYGASKLYGETTTRNNNEEAVIIRTSWVYSSFGNNFVKTMIRLMREKESIKVVNDQQGSPTYAADLAGAMIHIINSGRWVPGIYHYSNEGKISWYDFAIAIKQLTGSTCIVESTTTIDYPTPAKRPLFAVLDKEKIKNTYHVTIPHWQDSLQRCISLLM